MLVWLTNLFSMPPKCMLEQHFYTIESYIGYAYDCVCVRILSSLCAANAFYAISYAIAYGTLTESLGIQAQSKIYTHEKCEFE